jgi:hypothetical protein
VQAQAARLSDRQVHGAQRYALARRIGRLQGNQHLQRVIGALGAGHTNPPTVARKAKRLVDTPSSKVQRNGPAPAGEAPEMDAETATKTMLGALNRSLKATKTVEFKYRVNKKLGPYAKIKEVTVGFAGEIEASVTGGSKASISHGISESDPAKLTKRGIRKNQAESAGKSTSFEAKLQLKDTIKKLINVDVHDVELKWVDEKHEKGHVSGAIDIQGKSEGGFLAGVKLGIYNLDLTDPTDSSVGDVTPYGGIEGEIPLVPVQPRRLSWIQFPPVQVKMKGKVTVAAQIKPDKKAILAKIGKETLEKIGKRVAMITGGRAAGPIAARIVRGVRAAFGLPAAMISAGIMSVLVLLDAIIEGKRIRDLGTLAQRLAYVYSGAYVMAYSKDKAPASGSSATAQFADAGAKVAVKHKKDILAKVKKQAESEEIPMEGKAPAMLKKAVKKYIQENPVGIGTILPEARPPVNKYILDRFVKGREAALTRKAMSAIVSVWGGSTSDVKDSQEYKKFKESYLPAYTSDKALNMAIDNAMKDLEKQGKPVTPENANEALYEYFSEQARKTEQELS